MSDKKVRKHQSYAPKTWPELVWVLLHYPPPFLAIAAFVLGVIVSNAINIWIVSLFM